MVKKNFKEADITLLIFAMFGFYMSINTWLTSSSLILFELEYYLGILAIMLVYSMIKRIELISTSVIVFSVGLSLSREEFVWYLMVAFILIGISIANKSYKKLVVGDLFIATITIALTYIVSAGNYSISNIVFMFTLLFISKYVIIAYYFNKDKKADKVNNTWTIMSTLIILLRLIS